MEKNKGHALLQGFLEDFDKTPVNHVEEVHPPLPSGEKEITNLAKPKAEEVEIKKVVNEEEYSVGPAKEVKEDAIIKPDEFNDPAKNGERVIDIPILEKPASIESPTILQSDKENISNSPSNDNADVKRMRRQAVSSHLINVYNRLQSLGCSVVYDKINRPEHLIASRDLLMAKVMKGESLNEGEIATMKSLEKSMNGFFDRREKYFNDTEFDEKILKEIKELSVQWMEINNIDPKPENAIMLSLALQPAYNIATAFSHKLRYNTHW